MRFWALTDASYMDDFFFVSLYILELTDADGISPHSAQLRHYLKRYNKFFDIFDGPLEGWAFLDTVSRYIV